MGLSPDILIIDDSALPRLVVRQELEPLGATIREATNGMQALQMIEAQRPNLITLDLEMPELDGFGVCHELGEKKATVDLPIIVLSSRSDPESRLRALEAGAIEYFMKPFAAGSLQALVQGILERIERNHSSLIYSLDASRSIRRTIEHRLLKNGYRHQAFDSPATLCEALRTKPCDLLMLDFQLPNHGSYQVLDALKTLPRPERTAVIALSATRDHRELIKTYHSGARDLIMKPFTPEELLVRVDHQLNQQAQTKQLKQQATIDPLTGVYNRRELVRRARLAVAEALREERSIGMLILDIDHFKALNDAHGHPFGDRVLREVAQTLVGLVRPQDSFGRYGGEEFVLILAQTTRTGLAFVAERLRAAVERLQVQKEDGGCVQVRVSLGGHTWNPCQLRSNPDFGELIKPSDVALYAAKQAGRNRAVTDLA